MELTCQKEGSLLFVKAAEEARGLSQKATHFFCGTCKISQEQCTDNQRKQERGVSKSVSKEGSIWFRGRCWYRNDWRRGSRILSLRHGLEPSGVALYRAFPTTTGEVEPLCTTMRLTMNFIDGNKPL